MTYADFFKKNTKEGQDMGERPLGSFTTFEAWYANSKCKHTTTDGKLLTSKDFWSAFRICSLYDTSEDYKKAGTEQCAIAKEDRALFYEVYSRYKAYSAPAYYSDYITPFECDEKFGLVVADESHLQSGAMIKSLYKIAYEGRFIAL